jgi:hypothetical protein
VEQHAVPGAFAGMADHTIATDGSTLAERHLRGSLGAGALSAPTTPGVLMIGRLVIGALLVSKAKFRRVEIDDLVVKRLHYQDRV